jgi:RNA polymerase primary sigma factor
VQEVALKTASPQMFRIDEHSIGLYLRDIARYQPLSPREESEMAVRIRKGDRGALERLVKTNLRFVVSVARNYQHQGMALSDLINEGNLGLIKAAKRFDEKKNFKFISYAVWWIRQAILQSLADHSRILRIPVNRVSTIHQVGRASARLEQRFQRTPNAEEVAEALGLTKRDVERTLQIGTNHRSLDAPLAMDSGDSLGMTIRDDRAELPDEYVSQVSLTREVDRLLDSLSEREQAVLRLYFGIGEDTNHTLDEIGSKLDITRERVRQIKEKSLQKLKRAARSGRVQKLAD